MDKEKVICSCMGVTIGAVKDAVENGADSINDIQDATGAGTICGACFDEIEHLIDAFTRGR